MSLLLSIDNKFNKLKGIQEWTKTKWNLWKTVFKKFEYGRPSYWITSYWITYLESKHFLLIPHISKQVLTGTWFNKAASEICLQNKSYWIKEKVAPPIFPITRLTLTPLRVAIPISDSADISLHAVSLIIQKWEVHGNIRPVTHSTVR